jgi:polar amino acid transport system substrate-binding protein
MLLALAGSGLFAAGPVVIASDVWPGLVNADRTGCYVDILNEVFLKNGISYRLQLDKYDRGKTLFMQGKADGLLGAYADEIRQEALYPVWHLDCQVTEVLFRRGGFTWVDERTLTGRHVAWQKGFDMDVMLTVPVVKMEVASVKDGLAALGSERADFYIEERDLLQGFCRSNPGFDMASFTAVPFYKKKIYLVLAPSQKELAKLWDRELLKMVRNGRLKAIFVKWELMKKDEVITSYFMEGAH